MTIPDISINRIRRDFKKIFDLHKVKVTLVRDRGYSESGNYGSEGEPNEKYTEEIEICIQGQSSKAYTREKHGITTAGNIWKAYSLYTYDIRPQDRIVWDKGRYIVKEVNEAIKGNNTNIKSDSLGFVEFTIVKVDNDDKSFYTDTGN